MASSSSLPCEDQLSCSICLEVFKEPVTTPCGHNYCKSCITGYWDSTQAAQKRCPLCKKRFRQRPALRCNTSFRDILDQLRSMALLSPTEEQLPGPGDVPCDICLEPKHKALKTCVVCAASYCHLHLEPHQRVPSLKKHQLTDPVPDLDHRVCRKHGTVLELFCTVDQTCVCDMCLQEDHASHQCIPLERAHEEERESVRCEIARLTTKETARTRDVSQIQSHVEQSKKKKEIEIADVEKAFTALVDLINRDKGRLVQVIEQKYKDVLTEPEERISQLEKGIEKIQQRRAELEEVVEIEDHLEFLQRKPELASTPDQEDLLTQYDLDDEETSGVVVKSAVDQMKHILSKEMEKLIQKVQYPYNEPIPENALQIWAPPKDQLMAIQQNHAVNVTLDPDSAASYLSIYNKGKSLMLNPFSENKPRTWFYSRCFENYPFVVSTEGFSCRFYFEVKVSDAVEWAVGVVREDFSRYKTFNWLPGPNEGAWILYSLNKGGGLDCFDSHNTNPKKIGVFVDYEKEEVSFYDVDRRVLLTSITEYHLNEPVSFLKSAVYGLVGATTSNRAKFYPVIGVYKMFDSLELTPVITY
ncbi:hypothetical protein NL108_005271 [Boleophthalmus pectinirostris]|uniref:E3 ubiquitin/ISG15 ligase TRIM25-like n=1 Tax=Boleophthalmus pectinirostris TaxID=150288 RepID=UPI00242C88C8|nr:E3 ubiquitin/ISG15 ligase TRIM25-like [Boleophthalmus pectinirostris]KAJ0057378.1 hypothetical protein NL108_005271 [Boleophthalmus pectinirostris]